MAEKEKQGLLPSDLEKRSYGSQGQPSSSKSNSRRSTPNTHSSGSSEHGILYSPSYDRIRAVTAYDLDHTTFYYRHPLLVLFALGFFITTTLILVILISLSATNKINIGAKSETLQTLSLASNMAHTDAHNATGTKPSKFPPDTADMGNAGGPQITTATHAASASLLHNATTESQTRAEALQHLAGTFDFETHAQKVLDPSAWKFFSSGAMEEITMNENIAAFRRLRILPTHQIDVSNVTSCLGVKTFGGNASIPIGFSPTASHRWAHREGEIGTAKAAYNMGSVMIVSIDATTKTSDIAKAVPGAILWQQTYMFKRKNDTLYMIREAEKAGIAAIVLTIDKVTPAIRYTSVRGQIQFPKDYPPPSNYPTGLGPNQYSKNHTWEYIKWMSTQTKLPLVAKGVLTAFEARQAINHGAAAVMVSNHGGRVLDTVPATITQLPEIVKEVNGEVPVYMDGGIRTGLDVFKALALGADMVFLGRPVIWGLASDGQRGVENLITQIKDELINTMYMAGTNDLTLMQPRHIYKQSFPSLWSRDLRSQYPTTAVITIPDVNSLDPASAVTRTEGNTLPKLACVFDYEIYAKKVLDPNAWKYFSSGATEEITLRDNVAAYRRYKLIPNRMTDVSTVAPSLGLNTFGGRVSMPIGFSPTASHWWANREGEIGTARAAEALGTVMIVSIDSTTNTKEIAKAVPGAILWQQLYVFGVEKDTLYLIKLAEESGAKAIVVTIDKPAPTIRYIERRGQMIYPDEYPQTGNYPPDMGTQSGYNKKRSWQEITWLTHQTKLPVVVKGILTAGDARLAVTHGASAILVSNHGGRALDTVPATIDQLQEVVKEVGADVPVFVDGGIRSGVDVFKALAMGAEMVFLGRPILWGLAYDGQRGVETVVNQVKNELINTMELAGTPNITTITSNYVSFQPF